MLPPSTQSTPSHHSLPLKSPVAATPSPVRTPVLPWSFSPKFDPPSTPVHAQLCSPVLQRSDSPEFEPKEQPGKRQLRARKTVVTAEVKKLVVRMPADKVPRRATRAPPTPAPESVYPSHKPGAYMCPHPGCNKVFKFAYDVVKHEKCHDPDEENICHVEGCEYVTNKYKLFMDHKKMCGQEPFQCRYCKARFRSRQQRICHEAKH